MAPGHDRAGGGIKAVRAVAKIAVDSLRVMIALPN